ncbi:MAG: GNAT family N-acetyltransferase [Coriobacteriales bacterium]
MQEELELKAVLAREGDLPGIVELYQSVIDAVAGTEHDVFWELGKRPTLEDLQAAVSAGEMLLCVPAAPAVPGGAEEQPGGVNAARPRPDAELPAIIGAAVLNNVQAQGYEQVPWVRDESFGGVFCLHLFCVHPQLARQGVGSRFLQLVLAEARRRGAASLRLDVLPNNLPAQRLYKRNGFIDHGFYHLYYGEGLLTDFFLMEYPFE